MKFVTTAVQGGATIAYFPVSKAASAALRKSFGSSVSFSPEDKAWRLKGDDALDRLRAWVNENRASIEASVKAQAEQVAGVKASVAALSDSDRAEAAAHADANPVLSPLVSRSEGGDEWLVRTAYDPRIVEAMREGVIGAKFDRKLGAWRVPTTQTEALRAEMPGHRGSRQEHVGAASAQARYQAALRPVRGARVVRADHARRRGDRARGNRQGLHGQQVDPARPSARLGTPGQTGRLRLLPRRDTGRDRGLRGRERGAPRPRPASSAISIATSRLTLVSEETPRSPIVTP